MSGDFQDQFVRVSFPPLKLVIPTTQGVNMSLKIHLDAHLECFPENCGAFSDEHGERFHQEMASMEIRFKGKKGKNIAGLLAEYCWSIRRDTNPYVYKRSDKKPKYF